MAANAESLNVTLPPAIACVGLGAILSDTVVFQSSTTTNYDKQFADNWLRLQALKISKILDNKCWWLSLT
ncbi:manganese-dependent inorganic pyrophosphatase [Vibrio sp. JCM 19236]|nr:manganese-dependent inorganic pyrophosphatase [Vibrio sp. JCM 19236]